MLKGAERWRAEKALGAAVFGEVPFPIFDCPERRLGTMHFAVSAAMEVFPWPTDYSFTLRRSAAMYWLPAEGRVSRIRCRGTHGFDNTLAVCSG